jgi:hypothetical protein
VAIRNPFGVGDSGPLARDVKIKCECCKIHFVVIAERRSPIIQKRASTVYLTIYSGTPRIGQPHSRTTRTAALSLLSAPTISFDAVCRNETRPSRSGSDSGRCSTRRTMVVTTSAVT